MRHPIILLIAYLLALYTFTANAAFDTEIEIDFTDAKIGEKSQYFDGNNDGTDDTIFSTTFSLGFSVFGPGEQQYFIQGPVLGGPTAFTPDLRVDFLYGAIGGIGFGFSTILPSTGYVQVFDEYHNQITSVIINGYFYDINTGQPALWSNSVVSQFPEGPVYLPFDGIAAYATIDFNNDVGSYFIDNFTYTLAGTNPIDLFTGADPKFPILPDPFDPENPEFKFELEILEDGLGTIFPVFIDPVIAIGYTYTVDSGPNVASILIPGALPNGDSDFIIEINGVEYAITAGVTFDIFSVTGIVDGINNFKIIGIDTSEALNPIDSLAFITGLTFVSAGTAKITQTPITFVTDATNVPEPSTLLLFLLGIMGFLTVRKYHSK